MSTAPHEAKQTREQQLEELVISFVLDEIDYMTINNLGDAEQLTGPTPAASR